MWGSLMLPTNIAHSEGGWKIQHSYAGSYQKVSVNLPKVSNTALFSHAITTLIKQEHS